MTPPGDATARRPSRAQAVAAAGVVLAVAAGFAARGLWPPAAHPDAAAGPAVPVSAAVVVRHRTGPAPARPAPRSRLLAADVARAGVLGLHYRRGRARLSALGIAIGIAALVAVLGITRSSQSALIAEIDQLGPNLLTVTSGQTLGGQEAELPATPPARWRCSSAASESPTSW